MSTAFLLVIPAQAGIRACVWTPAVAGVTRGLAVAALGAAVIGARHAAPNACTPRAEPEPFANPIVRQRADPHVFRDIVGDPLNDPNRHTRAQHVR